MKPPKSKRAARAVRHPKGRGATNVQEALRGEILRLQLEPGAKLDEMSLVRKYGISRTPVREALIRLASEGLVILLPNRGAQVAPLDLVDIAQYFEALELTQRAINHWAARRRTDDDLKEIRRLKEAFDKSAARYDQAAMLELNRDMHAAIGHAAHNHHVAAGFLALLNHGMRLNWICLSGRAGGGLEDTIKRASREHDLILRAIERGDAATAESLATVHTESFRQRLKNFLNDSLAANVGLQAGKAERRPRKAGAAAGAA